MKKNNFFRKLAFRKKLSTQKTGVIHDPQGQSHVRSGSELLAMTVGRTSGPICITYRSTQIFDPCGQPVVTAGSDHCFCTMSSVRVCVRPSPLFKTNQISSDNNVNSYWRDCGSGRVDHWWQLSCFIYFSALRRYFWFVQFCWNLQLRLHFLCI